MIGQNDNINLEIQSRKKILLGFYGLFYVAILVIIVAIGYSYLFKLETFSKGSLIPFGTRDTSQREADLPFVKGTTTPPVDLVKEVVSTPEKLAEGKKLFESNCVSCHGAEGKGDGAAGKTLNPPPRNFHDLKGWTNGPQFSNMYKTLHEGITARGMASYSNLKPEERINMILHIRTFLPDYPAIDKNETDAVDKAYSLSKGVKLPNQIPVKTAEEKIIAENELINKKIETVTNTIINDKTEKSAEIFRNISFDIKRSVTAFANYPKWNENETALVKFLSLNPDTKGFKNSVSSITQDDLSALFRYLNTLFAK
jgi:hypothetical protein